MANTFRNHHFHLIWSTKKRENLIEPGFQDQMYAYIGGIVKQNKGKLLEIGGIENHVHLLVGLDSLDNYSELIRQIKGGSSFWINNEVKSKKISQKFSWQNGYGSFCVSYSMIDAVREYIKNQEQHHKKQTFENEFLKFLDLHGIQYDIKYVFD